MFTILAAVGFGGVLLFLFLRPVGRSASESVNNGGADDPTSVRALVLNVVHVMLDFRMLCLSFFIAYTGITQTFFSGNLPLFINGFAPDGGMSDLSVKLVRFFLLLPRISSSNCNTFACSTCLRRSA